MMVLPTRMPFSTAQSSGEWLLARVSSTKITASWLMRRCGIHPGKIHITKWQRQKSQGLLKGQMVHHLGVLQDITYSSYIQIFCPSFDVCVHLSALLYTTVRHLHLQIGQHFILRTYCGLIKVFSKWDGFHNGR